MKIYCITENIDTEIGLKLAGCDGITLKDEKEIEEKIEEVIQNEEIGVLVVTKNIYKIAKKSVDNIRLNKDFPLITII